MGDDGGIPIPIPGTPKSKSGCFVISVGLLSLVMIIHQAYKTSKPEPHIFTDKVADRHVKLLFSTVRRENDSSVRVSFIVENEELASITRLTVAFALTNKAGQIIHRSHLVFPETVGPQEVKTLTESVSIPDRIIPTGVKVSSIEAFTK